MSSKGVFPIRKILVFRSGLLGDTLVALPALHCLKSAFPDARITYVWQKIPGKSYVTPVDVLDGSGLIDEFYGYEIAGSAIKALLNYIKLWFFIRRGKFDIGIVLEAPHWPGRRNRFLRLCGIKTVVGPEGAQNKVYRDGTGRLPAVENISDSLVALLAQLNIALPIPGKAKFDILLSSNEEAKARAWLLDRGFEGNGSKRFVAVAPGSNMQTKRWALDNYYRVLNELISRHGVIPIVLGGPEDSGAADELIARWKRGLNAAGRLTIREGIALLRLCTLFVGNDTGTMHMAVAAGIPCVAVFSSIDMPGRWEPYGAGHHVMRAEVACAGCLLRECDKGQDQCINKIGPGEVYEKCERVLLGGVRYEHSKSHI